MPRHPAPKTPRANRVDAGLPVATTVQPEAPFRAIVELAPDALVVSDLAGHITLVNRQTEALFGYPHAALLGQPVEILLPEHLRVLHRQHRADYLAAPRTRPMGTRLSLWGRRSDGSEFPVSVSLSPLPAADTDGVYAVVSTIRDLTEHHRLEAARDTAEAAGQELRRLQAITDTAFAHPQLDELLNAVLERLQEVLEVDNAAILLLEEGGQHLVVRAARGPEAAVVGGVRIPVGEGFAGRIAATRVPLKVADLSTYTVVNPILHDRLRSVAGVSLVVDGHLIGVLHIGSATLRHFTEEETHLLQLVGERVALAVDHARISAREQQAHAAASARAAELAATFEALEDGIVVYDAAGHMVRVNAAGMRLFSLDTVGGFTQQAMQARAALTWLRDAHGVPLPDDAVPLVRVLRGERLQGADAMEMQVRLLDGQEKCVQVMGAPLRDGAGTITGAVVAYHDITERKRLERERSEVLGLVAHDLANPLTAVKAQVQRLQRQLARGEPLPADALDAVSRSVGRIERLVADLRVTESLEGGHFELALEPCDLVARCREAAEAARLASGRAVELVVPQEPVVVTADGDRIGQVLANLLANALKYSPAERPVQLTLTTEAVSSELAAGAGHRSRRGPQLAARIAVRDAGPGIPPEALPHLFDRFYRVPGVDLQPGSDRGLGLGLYIARELVERHGGHIGVDSVVGAGSTFWWTLPLAAAQ